MMNKLYSPFQPLLTDSGLQLFELCLEYIYPKGIFKNFVHSYLQISTLKPTPYPVIPDGTQAIFISPQGTMIGGAQTTACDLQLLQPGNYFGIRFYPGTLQYFFDLNLSEITNQFIGSHYLPTKNFCQLHDKIYQSHSFHERANICEQWLLQQFRPKITNKIEQALSLIYQSFGTIKINQLAKKIDISSRHLNRLFQNHIGLSTKTFSQIIRMQQVCKQLYRKSNDSLKTSQNLDFFDQAHLLNDFKKHYLVNPKLFFNRFMSDSYNK